MSSFSMPLPYKVSLSFVRNFKVPSIPNEARQNMVKVSVPARSALGLKGEWHPLGELLYKVNIYQESHAVDPNVQENLRIVNHIVWATAACASIAIPVIFNHGSHPAFWRLALTAVEATLSVFAIKQVAAVLGGLPLGFGKKEEHLYNYLLKLNHQEPIDLQKELENADN